ncbi:MAG: 16S rRNA (cytosine(1402)-N(4))-methyltransferase RsmH [Phycisphaerae bacterium]|jgi:16S rRNA (cytosine1402-N4)-methyltransferase|nr:16S rRNA (cytosine(1402)-N(4))-methyltransferase RsmH [Phycisphaerae bacterium]MDP7286886.1 16S rRNA (cytosine(1402)-N(4))-methyltransferase RsmH [Phycisphaerae bacterium]
MDRQAGHVPVLLQEVLGLLADPDRKQAESIVDCTVGLGGHAEALLRSDRGEGCLLVGMDADADNLRLAKRRLEPFERRVRLFEANFADIRDVLDEVGIDRVDAVLADLGVASTQLDNPERGFSFSSDGPLDMRMDRRQGPSAGDLVNEIDEKQLADLIFEYGQERYSRRVARAIVRARTAEPILSTQALAKIIRRAIPQASRPGRKGVDPATRTFQALRIAVNDELGALDKLLKILPDVLSVGGRACIISFHSLEDRRVKQAFRQWSGTGRARLITRKPVTASLAEQAVNNRSRSAKLRCVERVE